MGIVPVTRGPKEGVCNICGIFGPLTEDHTPPKGCRKPSQVSLHYITERLTVEKQKTKGRISQNGVKYRTLCEKCNSHFLGTEYDPYFVKFVNEVGDYLKSTLVLPVVMKVLCKPQRIMRSVLGHLCAQGVDRYKKGAITEPIREYILNSDRSLPDQIRIYAWVFPFRGYVMARDCAFTDLRVGKPVAIWLLKFFPIAFLVTFNEPNEYKFDFIELSKWRSEDIDFEVDMDVILRPLVEQYWPEAPNRTSIVMYGQQAITSFELKKSK
ncbi:MAG TPA: hypothetical protein VFX02_08605 [Gammaproteobacteria bacterium]|nr:hypothetical protein [Gammaproteobacteria bacterium]